MIIYVAHENGEDLQNLDTAQTIVNDLQMRDLANCYVCPLICFSHLKKGLLTPSAEMALRLDLLSVCDVLLVASDISDSVRQEIEFANLVGMEVRFLEI